MWCAPFGTTILDELYYYTARNDGELALLKQPWVKRNIVYRPSMVAGHTRIVQGCQVHSPSSKHCVNQQDIWYPVDYYPGVKD